MLEGCFLAVALQLQLIHRPKPEKEDVRQQSSRLVCIIFACAVQFLSYACQKRRKKQNKIDIFMFGLLDLVKGQWNLQSRFSNRIAKRSSLQAFCTPLEVLPYFLIWASSNSVWELLAEDTKVLTDRQSSSVGFLRITFLQQLQK